jgi:hypothetical protein
MVPPAGVGLGLIFKHRAGKTIFEFMAKTGVAMCSAQGILHTPARHVPFVISGAEGFITSKLLPAQVRHRSFWIVYQRRGSLLKKRFQDKLKGCNIGLNISANYYFQMT